MMATYCVDTQSGEKLPKERLLEMLDFIFQSILPEQGYTLRHEQLSLAQDIFTALERRSVLLSEAGVGIGKTHAYLIAAILVKRGNLNDFWLRGNYPGMAYIAKMPMVVATSSIALQKAIVRDYIPEISRLLLKQGIIAQPLTCVIRKGKEHYICDKRLHLLWRQTTDEHTKKVLAPLLSGKGGIDFGELDALTPYIKRCICVKGHCGRCGWRGSCRYHAFMEKAQSDKVDFQICNHNYLLADTLHRANGQRPLIPNYQAIVIDEAHKFVQAARQMYGVAVSNGTLPQLAKSVRGLVFAQGQSTAELWRDADKLVSLSAHLFSALLDNAPAPEEDAETERFATDIDSAALRRLHVLSELLDRLLQRLHGCQPLQKYRGIYSNVRYQPAQTKTQLTAFHQPDALVYWLETPSGSSGEVLLCAIPKRLGDSLYTDLWSKGVPIVLTSGTMAAGDKFTHVKLGLGLNRLSALKMTESVRPSPFDYKSNALLYISDAVPFPDGQSPQYIAAVADELERL